MTFIADTPPDQMQSNQVHESGLAAGIPPLQSLYFYVSDACNLACRHCWIVPTYVPNGKSDSGKYIKLEYAEKAIREAKPLGLASVKFTGGEPLLHPQFRDLVKLAKDNGLRVIIETNGTLIDREMAKFLREHQVEFVSISLDGARRETHEYLRAVEGSYDQAINGIKALVEQGFPVQIICTLHRGNVSELDEVIALAEQLGCSSVKFNHIQQLGRGERFINEQGLDVDELLTLYHHVENDIVPNCPFPIYFDIPFAFFSLRRLFVDQGRCTIRNVLGVLASGDLATCGIGVHIPELVYGHIERDNLQEVWNTNAGLALLRAQIPDQLEGICGECIHRVLCQGACVANNYHRAGKLNAAYGFCERAVALGLFPASRRHP